MFGFLPYSWKRILTQGEIVVGLWYYPNTPDIHSFHFIHPIQRYPAHIPMFYSFHR